MFLFYCMTTSGRDIARSLGIEYAAFSRRRDHWNYYKGAPGRALVNWGCNSQLLARCGLPDKGSLWNRDILPAVQKWQTLIRLQAEGLPVPQHSKRWEDVSGTRYLARRDGLSGGAGIEIVEKNESPPEGSYDFYVRYIPKVYELRLHVVEHRVIHEQFKFIPKGSGLLIRSHDNGATFSSKPLEDHLHPTVASYCRSAAIQAVSALGLKFAAVDMIVTKNDSCFILELNTAPGLTVEAGTLPAYIEAFRSVLC